MSLTLGKFFRLQHCATSDDRFVIVALDHRQNLKRALNPVASGSITYRQLASFKQHVTTVLAPLATGILLDPEYGVAPAITAGAITPGTGLLVAVEATGYTGEPTARESGILPGWSVAKIARLGAAGVKLLVYYHPDAPNAPAQEVLVDEVAAACREHDIPFFLEPLSFSLDPVVKRLPPAEKRQVVVETARRLTPLGIDVLKAEFPVDFPLEASEGPDEAAWLAACQELSQASVVPWVLLSAGVTFAQFEQQTIIACQAGASGVLVGRAVWQEATALGDADRDYFLRTTATERLARLTAICTQYGRPWTDFHPDPAAGIDETWYKNYA